MALTSNHQSPSTAPNTPAPIPYRLDTTAVVVHRPITTAEHEVIRQSIQPRENFWQFELRPWHYAVSLAATAGVTAAVVIVVLTHAAIR
jgi:hypothetical protein